jgi:hypothetical protein
MPVTFYSKWYNSGQGPPVNMWKAPKMLYDMDAVHLDMVGHIRASFGLGSELPFAPVGNQTRIVVASRHGEVRKRWARAQCMHLQASQTCRHHKLAGITNLQACGGAATHLQACGGAATHFLPSCQPPCGPRDSHHSPLHACQPGLQMD